MKVQYDGTVVLFTPEKEEERTWLETNVSSEPWQWPYRDALVVDHRYADELSAGVQDAGFAINVVPP